MHREQLVRLPAKGGFPWFRNDQGRWYIPDLSKQVGLQKLRRRELLREKPTPTSGRGNPKSVLSEAVRAGFE